MLCFVDRGGENVNAAFRENLSIASEIEKGHIHTHTA
jgi:hypothetical protein